MAAKAFSRSADGLRPQRPRLVKQQENCPRWTLPTAANQDGSRSVEFCDLDFYFHAQSLTSRRARQV